MEPRAVDTLKIGSHTFTLKEFQLETYGKINAVLRKWFLQSLKEAAEVAGMTADEIRRAILGPWRQEAQSVTIASPDGINLISTFDGCILLTWGLIDGQIELEDLKKLMYENVPEGSRGSVSKTVAEKFNGLHVQTEVQPKVDPAQNGT